MAQQHTLHVDVVTAAGTTFSGNADEVVAPGSEGQMGILPNHAPLLTTLAIGALIIKRGEAEDTIFVAGGFMEVYHNQVTILADDAEHASDIDEARAEEARQRAQLLLTQRTSDVDASALQGEIQRELGRLRVADIHRTRGRRPLTPETEN